MEIPLSQGRVALIDDADLPLIAGNKWQVAWSATTGSFYARRGTYVNGKRTSEAMHRLIMKATGKQVVDHINHDTLDNRKSNLRICTQSQNLGNQISKRGNQPYKGVCWCRREMKFRAYINVGGKFKSLGQHNSPETAAHAYNVKAVELFGDFALLNKVPACSTS